MCQESIVTYDKFNENKQLILAKFDKFETYRQKLSFTPNIQWHTLLHDCVPTTNVHREVQSPVTPSTPCAYINTRDNLSPNSATIQVRK